MRNIRIIFAKQAKDTRKNWAVLVQFIMLPLIGALMTALVRIDDMPKNFFVTLFSAMYVGMAPVVSMTSLVAEEKETNTLRVLVAANVRPYEYLLGTGSFVWCLCMLGSLLLCFTGDYTATERIQYMLIMAIGLATSVALGGAIGTWCKTQTAATSASVVVMLILAFLPMFSTFNERVAAYSKYLYSEQISLLLNGLGNAGPTASSVGILAVNVAVVVVLFYGAYRKCEFA